MATRPVSRPLAREATPQGLMHWLPGVWVLRNYQPAWLVKDLIAGIALTAILVPAGMAYAVAAGLPVTCGLYATFVALLAYAVFGPSRILVLGPDSALTALIVATILPLAAGSPERAVAYAGMLAILSGALCILAGLCRLSFMTDLLSKPVRYGYLHAIALTMLVGQLPTLLGFAAGGENLVQEANRLARGLLHDHANATASAIGLICLAVMLGFKRWWPAVPGILVAVVAATLVAWQCDLARAGIAVVGSLPQGLPALHIPDVSFAQLSALISGAIAIAMVSFADMSVLSRTFALRNGQAVDGNQELIALGVVNVAAGLFQGFAVSSSASRTPVAEAAGAQTQLTGVVGATCIGLLLWVAPGLLHDLPQSALAAVVIYACLGLMDVRGVVRLYQLRKSEFALTIVCFVGVAILGTIQGIFIAVSLALAAFIWRAWRPYFAVLGRVEGRKGYHDISRHPQARLIPGLVLFRWDAPLFFANAEVFHEQVLRAVANAPTPTQRVVVAAEPVTDVDITAADVLAELDRKLHAAGVDLCFAEIKGPVKDLLKRYGLFTTLGSENFPLTLGQAVDAYVATYKVAWRDWED